MAILIFLGILFIIACRFKGQSDYYGRDRKDIELAENPFRHIPSEKLPTPQKPTDHS